MTDRGSLEPVVIKVPKDDKEVELPREKLYVFVVVDTVASSQDS
jgi:hypothetical protein